MDRECYICGRWGYCDTHHLIGGSNRQKSDRLGLTIPVCRDCHEAIHKNPRVFLWLKEQAQRKAMSEQGWTVEDFIREFGKNYLEGEN